MMTNPNHIYGNSLLEIYVRMERRRMAWLQKRAWASMKPLWEELARQYMEHKNKAPRPLSVDNPSTQD